MSYKKKQVKEWKKIAILRIQYAGLIKKMERSEARFKAAIKLEHECESGCNHFTCGSIKHLEDCLNYPCSQAEMVDAKNSELDTLKQRHEEIINILNKAVSEDFGFDVKDDYIVLRQAVDKILDEMV